MARLSFLVPVAALLGAGAAFAFGLPLWAAVAIFFLVGPLVVAAAAIIHFGEEIARRRIEGRAPPRDRREADPGAGRPPGPRAPQPPLPEPGAGDPARGD